MNRAITKPRVISTVTTLDVDVDFNKIYLEIPKGFTEILGYVTLREKPRVRFADGKWFGLGGNECKYFIAKTKNLSVLMTPKTIQVSGSGNFEEAYLKCAKNGWVSKSIIRKTPTYKIINCGFRINRLINLEKLHQFLITTFPSDMFKKLPKEIVPELKTPSLTVQFKKPDFTYQFFRNGTILFSGIKKIENIDVPVEFFKQIFRTYDFGNVRPTKASTAKSKYMLAGSWNSLMSPVPRGFYIRPGTNGLPRLYPYQYYRKLNYGPEILNSTVNLGPIAPKVKKAFEEAGKPIPESTLKIFRNAGHPLNAIQERKKYAGQSNRRAPSWNAEKNGFYVRPGPGQQPYWYAIPKIKSSGRKTAIESYKKAGRNIPGPVRKIFDIPNNVKINSFRPVHEFTIGTNGILRINGKQATKLTKDQLIAIARNQNIAQVSNKMQISEIINYIQSKTNPARTGSFNITVGDIKYKFLTDYRVRRFKHGLTTREWSTFPTDEKNAIFAKVVPANQLDEFKKLNSKNQFGVIYGLLNPEKQASPPKSASVSSNSNNFNKELEYALRLKQNLGNAYTIGNEKKFLQIYKNLPKGARGNPLKATVNKAYTNFMKNVRKNSFAAKIKIPNWMPSNVVNDYRKFVTELMYKSPRPSEKNVKQAINGWLSVRVPPNRGSPAKKFENIVTGETRVIPARSPVRRTSPVIPKRSPRVMKPRVPKNTRVNYVYKIPRNSVNFSNTLEKLGINTARNWTWNEIRAALKEKMTAAKLKKLKERWNANVVSKASPTGATGRIKRKA